MKNFTRSKLNQLHYKRIEKLYKIAATMPFRPNYDFKKTWELMDENFEDYQEALNKYLPF